MLHKLIRANIVYNKEVWVVVSGKNQSLSKTELSCLEVKT